MIQIKACILVFMMILFFVGCTKQPTKIEKTKYNTKQITLEKFEADVKIDKETKVVSSKVNLIDPIKLYSPVTLKGLYNNNIEISDITQTVALKKAFLSALEKVNTPYFALVNPGFSNIEGFPINNYKDFISYLNPDIRAMHISKQLLLNDNFNYKDDEVLIILLPFKNKQLDFVVWNTEKTKNELK